MLTTAPLEYLHCDDGEAGQCHEGSYKWDIVKVILGDIPVFGCFGLAEKKYGWLVVMRMGYFRAPFNSHPTYLRMIGERYGSFAGARSLPLGICWQFSDPIQYGERKLVRPSMLAITPCSGRPKFLTISSISALTGS